MCTYKYSLWITTPAFSVTKIITVIAEMGSLADFNLGIVTDEPVYSDYHSTESRMHTFYRAPLHLRDQSEELAIAGLMYDKHQEGVLVCYYCAGWFSACTWKPNDDPWRKHHQHFPYCPHLYLSGFTDRVRSESMPGIDVGRCQVVCDPGQTTPESLGFCEQCTEPPDIQAVQVAMSMGFLRSDIDLILEIFHRLNGSLEGLTSQTLVDMLLFTQQNSLQAGHLPAIQSRDLGAELDSCFPRELNCLLQAEILCRFCHKQERAIVFLPCRHFFACIPCARIRVFMGHCHCGKEIQVAFPAYPS